MSVLLISMFLLTSQQPVIYLDPGQPIDIRVKDLISRLTLEEKVSQMTDSSPAIP